MFLILTLARESAVIFIIICRPKDSIKCIAVCLRCKWDLFRTSVVVIHVSASLTQCLAASKKLK